MLALRNFLQIILFMKKHKLPARRILCDDTCYGGPWEVAHVLQNGCMGLLDGLSSLENVSCRQSNKLEPITLVFHLRHPSRHM